MKLAKCLKRDVTVQVLLDYANADFMSEYEKLIEYGVEVRTIATSHGKMHHKLVIIDERISITGPSSFSQAADKRNTESTMVISSRPLAQIYRKEFMTVWKKGLDKPVHLILSIKIIRKGGI